jgi:hypothetical protein
LTTTIRTDVKSRARITRAGVNTTKKAKKSNNKIMRRVIRRIDGINEKKARMNTVNENASRTLQTTYIEGGGHQ